MVAKEFRALIAKADALGGGDQAEMLRLRAKRQVEEEHPIAPHRGAEARLEEIRQAHRGRVLVGKAKTDDPVPVFDQAGNLVGVCDPDDITPLGTSGGKAAPPPPPPPAAAASGADVPPADPGAGEAVAKAVSRCQVVVWDQAGKPYATDRRSISTSVSKAVGDDLVTVTEANGRTYQVSRVVLQSPEEQARDTGPVNAGGTTGMGLPRSTGPAAALPGDGPQARLRDDVPGRQVVKASSIGLPYRTLGENARERRLARTQKATGRDLSQQHLYERNPHSPEGHCICEAPAGHRVHPWAEPGARQVAKSAGWSCSDE
jgi:hypothetical protein